VRWGSFSLPGPKFWRWIRSGGLLTGDLLIEGDRITAIREEAGLIERRRADRVIEAATCC